MTKEDDELSSSASFLDDANHDDEVPCDALLCLQSYTRPSSHCLSETCAYCPIFTVSDGADLSLSTGCSNIPSTTHAAPFLPRHVLLYLLDLNASSNRSLHVASSSSSRTKTDQDIKQLAMSNKIRLLQLHGTAIAIHAKCAFGVGSIGVVNGRGDGNDDEDVAIMETCAYVVAAEMALYNQHDKQKANTIHQWFTSVLLPYFAGRTWFSSAALDAFCDSMVKTNKRKTNLGPMQKTTHWVLNEMSDMINELVRAGLLLPRRGVGLGVSDGYW